MDNFEILHRKYAKALIDFATEKRVADKIEEGLEKIIGILNNNQYLYDVLIHPEISLDEKRSLIGEICRRADFCHELKDFLLLLFGPAICCLIFAMLRRDISSVLLFSF